MCGGPPKKNRVRHIEKKINKVCVAHVIDACTIANIKLCIVIARDNVKLLAYVKTTYPQVKILIVDDYSMLSSYKAAFEEDDNDTLIVAGDLWSLKKSNVVKFINTRYENAMYRLKTPWGKNIESKKGDLIRRADVGDSLVLISNKDQNEYLSKKNINEAIKYFNMFYPNDTFDINQGNHLWTWLDYVFFFEISSSKNGTNSIGLEKGTIYIEDKVYLDND